MLIPYEYSVKLIFLRYCVTNKFRNSELVTVEPTVLVIRRDW